MVNDLHLSPKQGRHSGLKRGEDGCEEESRHDADRLPDLIAAADLWLRCVQRQADRAPALIGLGEVRCKLNLPHDEKEFERTNSSNIYILLIASITAVIRG